MEKTYLEMKHEKEAEYMGYINEHVTNVINSYIKIRTKIKNAHLLTDEQSKQLAFNITEHDASKYDTVEFDAYRRHFHFVNEKEREESTEDFEKAWEHHYSVNKHHWDHWKRGDITPDCDDNYAEMDIVSLLELICDWMAMSIKFGGSASSYYYGCKSEKLHFHPKTRKKLEELLELFEGPFEH